MGSNMIACLITIQTPPTSKMKLFWVCVATVLVPAVWSAPAVDNDDLHQNLEEIVDREMIQCPADGSPLPCKPYPSYSGLPDTCQKAYGPIYRPSKQSGFFTPKECCPSPGVCNKPGKKVG